MTRIQLTSKWSHRKMSLACASLDMHLWLLSWQLTLASIFTELCIQALTGVALPSCYSCFTFTLAIKHLTRLGRIYAAYCMTHAGCPRKYKFSEGFRNRFWCLRWFWNPSTLVTSPQERKTTSDSLCMVHKSGSLRNSTLPSQALFGSPKKPLSHRSHLMP